MTTEKIPADIRAKAEALAEKLKDCAYGAHGAECIWETADAESLIAEALMQERERCAKIAENFADPNREFLIFGETSLDAGLIAEAIRRPDTP